MAFLGDGDKKKKKKDQTPVPYLTWDSLSMNTLSDPWPMLSSSQLNYITTTTNTTNWSGMGQGIASPAQAQRALSEEVQKQIDDAKLSPHAALTGWRAWMLVLDNEHGPTLQSVAQSYNWKPYEQACATDLKGEQPSAKNQAGIYAYRSLDAFWTGGHTAYTVFGPVAMWGKVVHGEIGYRAEFAYPKMLYVMGSLKPWWMKHLGEYYGVEVASSDVLPRPIQRIPDMGYTTVTQTPNYYVGGGYGSSLWGNTGYVQTMPTTSYTYTQMTTDMTPVVPPTGAGISNYTVTYDHNQRAYNHTYTVTK